MGKLTHTIGEQFGLPPKPVDATSENYSGRQYSKLCGCGRGRIVYDYIAGYRVPQHAIWDGGISFGTPTFADCCKQCDQEDYQASLVELC